MSILSVLSRSKSDIAAPYADVLPIYARDNARKTHARKISAPTPLVRLKTALTIAQATGKPGHGWCVETAMQPRCNRFKGQHYCCAGFTLVEMFLVMAVVGVMSLIISPVLGELTSRQMIAHRNEQRAINHNIARTFEQYAALISATGALPKPATVGGIGFLPLDPLDKSLVNLLLQNKIPVDNVNDDNRAAHNLRGYQSAGDLTQTVPFNARSGPSVTISYQYGVIYSTTCRKDDVSCNRSSAVPENVLTKENYAVWKLQEPDFAPAYLSSFPQQMEMLAATSVAIDKVRDALTQYFSVRQAVASERNGNFFPDSASVIVGAAASNQGCWHTWIDLAKSPLLTLAGRAPSEYGATAWRAPIEYCRDYDAQGVKGPNVAPYFGALRIHRQVSLALAPDNAMASNNIFLTF